MMLNRLAAKHRPFKEVTGRAELLNTDQSAGRIQCLQESCKLTDQKNLQTHVSLILK